MTPLQKTITRLFDQIGIVADDDEIERFSSAIIAELANQEPVILCDETAARVGMDIVILPAFTKLYAAPIPKEES